MTTKEKSKDLVSKYVNLTKQTTGAIGTIYNSKKCALISVNEILDSILDSRDIEYWQEVKKEIEQL